MKPLPDYCHSPISTPRTSSQLKHHDEPGREKKNFDKNEYLSQNLFYVASPFKQDPLKLFLKLDKFSGRIIAKIKSNTPVYSIIRQW